MQSFDWCNLSCIHCAALVSLPRGGSSIYGSPPSSHSFDTRRIDCKCGDIAGFLCFCIFFLPPSSSLQLELAQTIWQNSISMRYICTVLILGGDSLLKIKGGFSYKLLFRYPSLRSYSTFLKEVKIRFFYFSQILDEMILCQKWKRKGSVFYINILFIPPQEITIPLKGEMLFFFKNCQVKK